MSRFIIRGSLAAGVLIASIAAGTAQTGGSSSTGSSSAGSISGSSSGSGVTTPGGRRGSAPSGQSGAMTEPQTSGPGITAPAGTSGTAPGIHPIQREQPAATPAQKNDLNPQVLGSGGKPAGESTTETQADEANADGESKAGGSLLVLTEEQKEKIRSVILSYSIAPRDVANFPLRLGAAVPADVPLKPLPPEVAKIVPGHKNYSYVVARNQIAIVITEKREIDLLIPG